MSVNISISADTAEDARTQMARLLGGSTAPGWTAPDVNRETAAIITTNTPRAGETAEQTAARTAPRQTAKQKKAEAEAARNISTGGERVDPETAKQDAKDEADETIAAQNAKIIDAKKWSHDDVRDALGEYVNKFGMPAAQEDGPKVLVLLFGEGKAKVSDIPDDQVALAKAVEGIKEMSEKNPFKREPAKAAS